MQNMVKLLYSCFSNFKAARCVFPFVSPDPLQGVGSSTPKSLKKGHWSSGPIEVGRWSAQCGSAPYGEKKKTTSWVWLSTATAAVVHRIGRKTLELSQDIATFATEDMSCIQRSLMAPFTVWVLLRLAKTWMTWKSSVESDVFQSFKVRISPNMNLDCNHCTIAWQIKWSEQ